MDKKLLIVDGTSILAEAYYKSLTKEVEALHSLKDAGRVITKEMEDKAFSTLLQCKKGVPVNAVQGFFKVLFDAIDKTNPSHLIISWGGKREDNFRRKIFPGYKDDGKVKDRELEYQERLVKEFLKNVGICQLESSSVEALDLAGILITMFKDDFKIEILARNTLSLQFTDEATVWFRTPAFRDIERKFNLDCSDFPKNSIRFDEEFLLKYKNLKPYQIPDYRALIGNSFSKIPGVKSVGEVTTLALLEEYDCIENIYEDIDACSSHDELVDFGNTLTKHLMLPFNPIPFLVKGREEAFLGKKLATYLREKDATLTLSLDESEFDIKNIDKVGIVKKLKVLNLAPIKCNITKNIAEIIENLDFSSLVIMYNQHIFSESNPSFIDTIDNIGSLDSLSVDDFKSNNLYGELLVTDDAVVAFGDKLKFDFSNVEFYSEEVVSQRIKEREELKKRKEERKQQEILQNTADEDETPTSETTETYRPTLIVPHFDLKDGIELNADVDCEVELEEERVALSEVEVAIADLDEYEIIEENYSETPAKFVQSPTSQRFLSAHEHSNIVNNSTSKPSTINQNTNSSKKAGLSLLEQMVISRYVCNECGEEFLLVGSTAEYCVKCGAKNVNNN